MYMTFMFLHDPFFVEKIITDRRFFRASAVINDTRASANVNSKKNPHFEKKNIYV